MPTAAVGWVVVLPLRGRCPRFVCSRCAAQSRRNMDVVWTRWPFGGDSASSGKSKLCLYLHEHLVGLFRVG